MLNRLCLLVAVLVPITGGICLGQDGDGGTLLDRKLELAKLFLTAGFPDANTVLEPELEALASKMGPESAEAGTHRELLLGIADRSMEAGELDEVISRCAAVKRYPKAADPERYRRAALMVAGIARKRAEKESDPDKKADALELAAKEFEAGDDIGTAKKLKTEAMGIRLADGKTALEKSPKDYDQAFGAFEKVAARYEKEMKETEYWAKWLDLKENTGILTIQALSVTAKGAPLENQAAIRLEAAPRGETRAEKLRFRKFRWRIGVYRVTVTAPGESRPFMTTDFTLNKDGNGFRVPNRKPKGMVFIPGGMAKVPGKGQVRVQPFFIDMNEVTYAEIQAFVKQRRPGWDTWFTDPGHPASDVWFQEADQYARSIGKMLPTREQWIRAAFGDSNQTYNSGNSRLSGEPEAVGKRTSNPYGLSNMGGNVSEWLRDGWALGGSFKSGKLVKPLGDRRIQRDFMRDPRPGPRAYEPLQGQTREDYRPFRIIKGRNTEEVGLRCVIDL